MPPLRSVDDQLARMLAAAPILAREVVPVDEVLGRVLAEPLPALLPVPPFTNSAMDGYAVRLADLAGPGATLPVAGDAPAGAAPVALPPGSALRIMTGAPLPDGADTVIPVELTDQRPGAAPLPAAVTFSDLVPLGANIRREGEDVRPGDAVFDACTRVDAAGIGALRSVGWNAVSVVRRPRVVVLATGDELVADSGRIAPGQIPDSNGPMLAALVESMGAEVTLLPSSTDSTAAFWATLAGAAGANLILTTGGVSAGAFEVVREAFTGRGVEFVGLAMQPGKPQGFGTIDLDGKPVLVACLPGNPVSVFVSFHVLIRPLLADLAGLDWRAERRTLRAVAGHGWTPPKGRHQYAPVIVAQDGDVLVARQPHALGAKSHLVASLHLANALASIPADVTVVAEGDPIDVLLTGPLR